MSKVIKSIEDITPHWIGNIFNISTSVIADIKIETINSHPATHKWRLRISYNDVPDDVPDLLFLKSGENHHGQEMPREALFYQNVSEIDAQLPVVPCYDVTVEGNWSHILLKDLSTTHRTSPPTQLPPVNADCERIIDGLADLHAYWWDHPLIHTTFGGLPSSQRIKEWCSEDAAIYAQLVDYLGDRLPEKYRVIIDRANEKLPDLAIKRFGSGNMTLTFEDVHAGNFLYPNNPTDKLYFIDWEQWGINPAMNDLAYMMAMFWSPERRARLEVPYLKRYHERIQNHGVGNYSWDDLLYDYRFCVITHLFMPAYNWKYGGPPDVWWNHIERLFAAYHDLDCARVLV